MKVKMHQIIIVGGVQAEENLGMPMVFMIVSAVKEKLETLVEEEVKSKEEEQERLKREAEEKEHVSTLEEPRSYAA